MKKYFKRVIAIINPFQLVTLIRYLVLHVVNLWRKRFKKLGYILYVLPADMPALPEVRGFVQRKVLGDPPMSLYDLDLMFKQIAADPRPKGIILHVRGFDMGVADLQTLRDSMMWLRKQGKQVICYAHNYDLRSYYVASAADKIVLIPGSDLSVIGLRLQPMFMKDALASIGVEFDSVPISPFKSAMDQFTRNDMSPEVEAQFNWLLDSNYDTIVKDIAAGRQQSADAVRVMIDNAPYIDQDALENGYIDAVVNEEGLSDYLGVAQDHIVSMKKAKKVLLKYWQKRQAKHVALIQIKGMIIDGKSGKPPVDIPIPILGNERAGDLTVVQHIREVMEDDNAAAVVVFVDSPGGSASASEAMASALDELAKERPLVVYMNNVAASGGYYVSTPSQWIVAQSATITGSIGVIMGKAINRGLYEKLHINRVEISRGENAGIMASTQPFTDEQRVKLRQSIERIYDVFTARVATCRKMTQDAVNEVGGGRVWTGEQALRHGLVDELGGLHRAFEKARELAGLPDDAPIELVMGKGDKDLIPHIAEKSDPSLTLRYLQDSVNYLLNVRAQMFMPLWFDD